jgi:hypothetical protein
MSAQYISGSLIRSVVASNGKKYAVEFVDRTTAWWIPSGFPSQDLQNKFVDVALKNVEKFKAGTTKISMKYSHLRCSF